MKTWNQLTPAERRVELAKDVIKQIRAETIIVKERRGYIQPLYEKYPGGPRFDVDNSLEDEPLTKDVVARLKETCSVCARGALLISRIDKFNTITPAGLNLTYGSYHGCGSSETSDGLVGAFTDKQLNNIESAFEFSPKDSWSPEDVWERFGAEFKDDKERLMAIMQNIIDHKGTFKPAVLYEVK